MEETMKSYKVTFDNMYVAETLAKEVEMNEFDGIEIFEHEPFCIHTRMSEQKASDLKNIHWIKDVESCHEDICGKREESHFDYYKLGPRLSDSL